MLTPNSNGWYTTRTISVSLHDCEYIVHLNKGHIEDGYTDDEREDNIECVHPRELELGSASIAALIYYLDKSL